MNEQSHARTHEENQERAFVAASHRGDRSMEGRLESAHKASEIHKQRTGKELKVTEELVKNEDMYPEVDEKNVQAHKNK